MGGSTGKPESGNGLVSGLLVSEDALDDFGVLGWPGTEVPGRGVDGCVPEQGLDLGGIGSALPTGRVANVCRHR